VSIDGDTTVLVRFESIHKQRQDNHPEHQLIADHVHGKLS
jgi:hypothetical protein